MSTPKEIGHLVLNVTDVERSTRFYRDVVGFQVSRYRPDGIMMELFADAFATEEEGLAYMSASGRPAATPMDITAPEPPMPEIPQAGFAKVG